MWIAFEEIYNFKKDMILNDVNISIPNLKHNIILIAVNAAKDKWLYHRNLIDLELLIHINGAHFEPSLSKKDFYNELISVFSNNWNKFIQIKKKR